MRQWTLRVAEVASLGNLIRLTCEGPNPDVAPGQACLALADLPGHPFLRLPLFFLAEPEQPPAFLIPITHPYARLQPGQLLDVLGPVGRGFRLPQGAANLLVIAGSLDRVLPAILAAVRQGLAVTVLTPRSAALLPPVVEVHRGPLTAELASWADAVLLDVGEPQARARHVRELAPARGQGYVQALFHSPMPCGVGACQACWAEPVPGRRRLACLDGPVFPL